MYTSSPGYCTSKERERRVCSTGGTSSPIRGNSEVYSVAPLTAAKLGVAWAFSIGVLRGHDAQPLIVGNTMSVVRQFLNVSDAIVLPHAGQLLKWKFRPDHAQPAIGRACCDV